MSSTEEKKNTMKSLHRTLEILNTFTFECPRQRVIDIASKLGMTQSIVSRHLSVLYDEGLLRREESTGYYYLGNEFIKYAGIVLSGSDLYRHAYPEIQKLHIKTGLRSYLGIFHDNRYMCIGNAGYESPNDSFTPVGYTYPLHSTAIGKLFLAYLPKSKLQSALERDKMVSFQPNTITDLETLKETLEDIRRKGYATISGESLRGISSIAAPIFNNERKIVGAISVSDQSYLIDIAEREKDLADLVVQTATGISSKLGFFPYAL